MHGIFHNNGVTERDHVVAYICDVEGDIEVKPKSMEIAEIGFFDSEDLPSDTDLGTVRRIKEVVLGQDKSENW